ncbi:MAG: peptidoglycan editing factor PgeF [Bacillota bacterium]
MEECLITGPQAETFTLDGEGRLYHAAQLEAAAPVVAVLTTRRGGVSRGHLDSCNLGLAVGDDPEAVLTNRRRALSGAGLSLPSVVAAEQVHGGRVARVGRREAGRGASARETAIPGVDALVTDEPDLTLMIGCADCVPVYLVDPKRPAIGLAHAGWRGTVARIAAETVRAMADAFGSRPEAILAAVGPSIGPCCYEVDEPVAGPVRRAFGEAARTLLRPAGRPDRWFLDLWAANRQALLDAGLRPENIGVAGVCTSCHQDRFFSHRASGGKAGRMAALLAIRPATPNL